MVMRAWVSLRDCGRAAAGAGSGASFDSADLVVLPVGKGALNVVPKTAIRFARFEWSTGVRNCIG